MQSLKITFTESGVWDLHFDALVTGFEDTVQCALVNATTQRGTVPAFPEAGTNLLQQGMLGLILDLPTARHSCNFAAAETAEFVNAFVDDKDLAIGQFNMQPVALGNGMLQLELRLVSTTRITYGILLS